MGYTATDPHRAVFAAQLKLPSGSLSNVKLFDVDITSVNEKRLRESVDDSALLALCRNDTHAYANCTDSSSFFPEISSHRDLLFAYRAWNGAGDGIGSQALAIQSSSGVVKALTYEKDNVQRMDSCPRFVPGSNDSLVLFSSDNGDERRYLKLHDLTTGVTTTLEALGQVAEFGGCPDFFAHQEPGSAQFFFIAGEPNTPSLRCEMRAASVSLHPPYSTSWYSLWQIPLLAYGGAVDVMAYRDCSRLHPGSSEVLACVTADDRVAIVDITSGETRVNYSVPMMPFQNRSAPRRSFCRTPECYVVL